MAGRHDLRLSREVIWILMIKLVALAALWELFFSPAHQMRADPQATGQRLGVAAEAAAATSGPAADHTEERGDD